MGKQSEKNPYAVIIGDIKQSRKIQHRKKVQDQFNDVLRRINEKYAEDIASEFMITLGDGFQGLLKNHSAILPIIFEIEMAMSPVELRFGIGLGEISTSIQHQNSMEMDGPAYHRARQMIERIEVTENQYAKNETNIMLYSGEEYRNTDQLLNTVFSLASALKDKWSERQREIIYAYYLHGENQYQAAEALGIAQSSVNKALNTAKYYTYKAALSDVSRFLTVHQPQGGMK